tara:strand:- start:122 stop:541 length:420 start_codon:yes stop_codon:yes gene_type:complete
MVGILIASGSSPYISPGIQIGLTSKVKFFMSAQITFGYVSYSGPPPFGVTLGFRVYKIQEKWKRYRYGDLQIWPFVGGIGIGKMIDKDGNKYTRFKTGVGAFGYATYDYCKDLEIAKHNFGVIGTLPIFNILGGNYSIN